MLLEIPITPEMRQRAQHKVDRFAFHAGVGLSRFGSERERTLFGYLGEQMVSAHLAIATDIDDFQYDLSYKGHRLEVKSISCKFKPLPHYLCTVNSYDLSGVHKQSADYYVFTRILNDMSKGWLLGYMKCAEFFEKGRFIPQGSELIKGKVNFEKANATVLEISRLTPINTLQALQPKA